MTIRIPLLGSTAVLVVAGCAASQAPKELVDARAAYARASAGESAQLSPAALHDARVALDAAETSFSNDGDSTTTRDEAYVAARKAQLAEVLAATEIAKRDQEVAKNQADAARKQNAEATRGQLAQAKEQLATAEQNLQQADRDLVKEREARAAAEKKAREALDRLSVANALAVKDEPRGTVITVPSGVLFASGKADLLPGARARLEPVAEALSHEQDHKILIEGHTDSQGSDASNLELSQLRAQTVRDFFAAHGVPADHMTANGLGEARPVADNATAEGRANNRRVEIVIQPIEKR
ncbi:MAG TPA: OmpA family protein [Polyangiaceae bacterium]|nr:OmpA family protein [Polyangiaceae bacterium]